MSHSKHYHPKRMIYLLLLIVIPLLLAITWVIKVRPAIGADSRPSGVDPEGPPIGSPPVLGTVSSNSPVSENDSLVISGNFSDPDTSDTFTLDVTWGNGDRDIYEYTSGTTGFSETHQYRDDNPSGTISDQYTINISLTDSSGLIDTDTITITVNNVAPTLASVVITPSINENGTATLSGDIVDPSSADTFSLGVIWGDGNVNTINYPAGTTSFSLNHQYRDDNPSGTAADEYTISLTITDDDGGSSNDSTSITVNNVAPVVQAGADQQALIFEVVSFNGSFTDPGSLDTHTIEWNFGDGTPVVSGSLTPSHTFTRKGVYTVTLTVRDDDNGVGVDTLEVTIDAFILQLPMAYR